MRAKTVATLYIEAERKGSQPFKVIREDWMSYYCSNECGITTNRAKDARFTSLPETSTVKLIPASPLWRVQSTEHLIRKPSNHFSKKFSNKNLASTNVTNLVLKPAEVWCENHVLSVTSETW